MAKIEKHAEFLDTLHGMITKEGSQAGHVTGKPGADTHYASVGKEHDTVDKNKEGKPETNPQEVKQEKGKDAPLHGKSAEEVAVAPVAPAAPVAAPAPEKVAAAAPQSVSTAPAAPAAKDAPNTMTQKAAAEGDVNTKLAELGQQLLNTINEMNKQGSQAGHVTGVAGKDTHYASVGKEHDTVDKNKEGKPENNPQEFKQEKGKDAPLHGKKAEELDLDKEASFELGRQFARAFLSNSASDANIYKEAGRRDFEALIAQASAELESEVPKKGKAPVAPVMAAKQAEEAPQAEELAVKQAEEAGAAAFYDLVKQAQVEEQYNQVKYAYEQQINALATEKTAAETKAAALSAKLAERDAEIQKQAEEAKLDAKFAQWGGRVVEEVISRLKSEPSK